MFYHLGARIKESSPFLSALGHKFMLMTQHWLGNILFQSYCQIKKRYFFVTNKCKHAYSATREIHFQIKFRLEFVASMVSSISQDSKQRAPSWWDFHLLQINHKWGFKQEIWSTEQISKLLGVWELWETWSLKFSLMKIQKLWNYQLLTTWIFLLRFSMLLD